MTDLTPERIAEMIEKRAGVIHYHTHGPEVYPAKCPDKDCIEAQKAAAWLRRLKRVGENGACLAIQEMKKVYALRDEEKENKC